RFSKQTGDWVPEENLFGVNDIIIFTKDELKKLIADSITVEYLKRNKLEDDNLLIESNKLASEYLIHNNIIPNTDEKIRIGTDNICPITNKECNDETCTPGAECNISNTKAGNIVK